MSKSWIVISRNNPPDTLMYSTGGGAGSFEIMLTISTSPISPATIRCCSKAKLGSKRRLNASIAIILLDLTLATTCCTRGKDKSIGFSQNTCLPEATACSIKSAWVSVAEQTKTPSIVGSANISSGVICPQPRASLKSSALG